jgi:hypothetical protein
MSGYFNFQFKAGVAETLTHTLNVRYKGARRFDITAPDAPGTLRVYARNEEEAADHLRNALFELIFNRGHCGASVENPACIYCGYRTESRGRNSSGTRGWRCLSRKCKRSFVINRQFRGGLNHPQQSKKPEFHRLVFVEGKTIGEARDILKISHGAACNWYEKMAAIAGGCDKKCPCGKPIRHRGTCSFRLNYRKLREHRETRESLGEITRRAAR